MAGPRQPRKKKAAAGAADDPRPPSSAAELRRQAEDQLDGLAAAPAPEDAAAVVHELRVHQIELEMQNKELRSAQLELEAQRAKYYELFDLAPVGYVTLSEKGIVGDANLTAARLLGVERQLLVGQPFSAFVFAADRSSYYRHVRSLRQTGWPQTCELRLRSVGAEPFWARLEWPQRSADGAPLRYHLIFTDVHERVLAEAALRESEAKYREVVERSNDGIGVLQRGLVVFANEALAQMLGYSVAELTGLGFLTVVQEGQHAQVAERVRRRLAGERLSTGLTLDLVRKDGAPVTVEVSGGVITYEGAPADLVLARDISARKQAEEALRLSEDKFAKAFHGSPDAILISRLSDGRVVEVNDGFLRLSGFTREEALAGSTIALGLWATPADRERVITALRRDGSVSDLDIAFRSKAGEVLECLYAGAIIEVEGEAHALSLVHDITARKLAEEESARTLSLLESTMESTADGVLVVDGKGGIVWSNERFREMWGIPEAIIASADDDAALGFVLDRLKEPEVFLKTVRDLYNAPEETSFDVLELRDGRVLERHSQPQRIGDSVVGRVWSFHDVTVRKQAEEELRETRDYIENLLGYANAPIIVWDPDQRITRFNRAFEELTGRAAGEVVGKPLELLFPADERRAPALELVTRASAGERWQVVEIPILRADGEVRTVLWNSATLYAADGATPVATIGQGQDITARKQAEEELAHLNAELASETTALAEANATITRIAATDHLTDLANRRCFYESLEKAVSLARRHGSSLVVASLDLDGLKRVNDSAGHRAGDEVLTSFAALLVALCRAEDLPARLGGDEFSVLLPGIDLSGASGFAERVLAAVRSCATLTARGVTVSGGVAQWAPGEHPDDLLRRADEALYAAKRGGGDSVAGGG